MQVSTATETEEQAIELASDAVRNRLAVGAQITKVKSVFWHHGEYGTGEERQIRLKTTADRYPELEAYLLEAYPWDNPEVCAVPIVASAERWKQRIDTVVEEQR
ncbi:divalent-cation tolerance protein CutA [Streptomyces sp. R302]|uniref:divalent-cation tolerance protein CutA n=1 Tax=unclassified Streptomyces TaxID=2593676 RepID=UPI00145DBC58|nr:MULTISPECIES: divalent cation tolerance protein CutA [unclassified Streptomyces]NML55367.1 divalent-cation tolerance protein CutA [Streptomyces sp. R301]NML80239.1 divalent-cation tolerance protein CutA [Streptomyces sp. R302]